MSDKITRINEWIPAVEEESCNGVNVVPLRTRHFSNGRLFLTGEVTEEMANDFVSQMLYLMEKGEPVEIYINSPGGSVNAGLVIYDMIQACAEKIDIDLYCVGLAASMGAVLLCAGEKGKRSALPHSRVLIHQPLGGAQGQATEILIAAKEIEKTRTELFSIIAQHTGQKVAKVAADGERDYWMTAQEALAYGMVDEILTKRSK